MHRYIYKHIEAFLIVWCALFLYGMLLPYDWEQSFGAFGNPLLWAANNIPSVRKIPIVTESLIPELVIGFFAFAVYIPPLYGSYIIWWTIFDHTGEYRFRLTTLSLQQREVITHFIRRNEFKVSYFFVFFLFFFVLFLSFYIYPFDEHNVNAVGRGRLFKELMSLRFTLSFTGATFTAMFSYIFALSFICLYVFFDLIINKKEENDE